MATTCSNCGEHGLQWSTQAFPDNDELARPRNSRGERRPYLLYPNTFRRHMCIRGRAPNIKNSKTKGMPCKSCGTYVEFHDYYKQPRYQEVETFRQHTMQRCGNLQVEKGIEPRFNYHYGLELFDYSIYEQWRFVTHSMPPESWLWDYFRPALSIEDKKMVKLGRGEPESQKEIRRMNLAEFVTLLRRLGHQRPLETETVDPLKS